jgi:hypothetical protein
MKTPIALFIASIVMAIGLATAAIADTRYRTDRLLPEDFTVYLSDGGVTNRPMPGARPSVLPTRNLYRGGDGGYIACYGHQETGSAYRVGDNIYVMGQVRLRGAYSGRIFQPRGHRGQDISALASFKRICGRAIAACRGNACWAGGDTGGWFGIP